MMLPVEDWDTLANLALRTSVAQIGVSEGVSTATLAKTANLVIAMMPVDSMTDEQSAELIERWWADVEKGEALHKCMPLRGYWPEPCRTMVDASFGLAVVDPVNSGNAPLRAVLDEAQRIASTVVIIRDEMPHRMAEVIRAGDRPGWERVNSGRLWVLRFGGRHTERCEVG